MKNYFRIIIIISVLFWNISSVKASECYNYHTLHYHELYKENNHLVYRHTVKDPNAISYVSQDKIILKNIVANDFKIIAEDKESILFRVSGIYYIIEKDFSEVKNYGVAKIGDTTSISEHIGTQFICKNGIWHYLETNTYSDEVVLIKIENMPDDLEILTGGFQNRFILLKNEQYVYVYNYQYQSFNKVDQLTGKYTRYVTNSSQISNDFLYDNDTFYFLEFGNFNDITSKFKVQKEWIGFRDAEIVQHKYDVSLNTKDGYIWMFSRFDSTLTPLRANYLNKYNELIVYKNKVYNSASDALRKEDSINMDAVIKPMNFRQDTFEFYTDDVNKYYFDYNTKKFKIVEWLNVEAEYFDRVNSYSPGNQSIYIDEHKIHFVESGEKTPRYTIHKSFVKHLKIAYAYDNKLLIDNDEIKNIADKNSMVFLGSTIDVISGCDDGGRGSASVQIDTYFFFKDKKSVYVCNSLNLKMREIESVKPENYSVDNYSQLMYLMTLLK